jgi:hypothetical protein
MAVLVAEPLVGIAEDVPLWPERPVIVAALEATAAIAAKASTAWRCASSPSPLRPYLAMLTRRYATARFIAAPPPPRGTAIPTFRFVTAWDCVLTVAEIVLRHHFGRSIPCARASINHCR